MELIYQYSRAQAIEDGVLVDVSETAREAGFRIPLAVTRTVWRKFVEVPPAVPWQDEQGRLWDVIWMLRCAIDRNKKESTLLFTAFVQNDVASPQLILLKAVCGSGDDGQPTITVMLPEED